MIPSGHQNSWEKLLRPAYRPRLYQAIASLSNEKLLEIGPLVFFHPIFMMKNFLLFSTENARLNRMELYFSMTQGVSDNGICRHVVQNFRECLCSIANSENFGRNDLNNIRWPDLKNKNLGMFFIFP